jgi:hypothetical protein
VGRVRFDASGVHPAAAPISPSQPSPAGGGLLRLADMDNLTPDRYSRRFEIARPSGLEERTCNGR